MRYISLHRDNVSNTEAAQRHPAAGLAANTLVTPDAGAIWEAKFIIWFLREAASSVSECIGAPSAKAPDIGKEKKKVAIM